MINKLKNSKSLPNVVVIGGGSGVSSLLTELKYYTNVTAVVSMMDSGGSSGRLRNEQGILPPGDILKCILALLPDDESSKKWYDLLNYRFEKGESLKGHSLGNLLLSAAYDWEGGTAFGIAAISQLLNIQGKVLPVTLNDVELIAKLNDGTDLVSETCIDLRTNFDKHIEYIYLSRRAQIYKPVIDEILAADYIIIGPGSLYTSILPNFLVEGLSEALLQSQAPKIYIVNLVTDPSETHQYKASDFIQKVEEYYSADTLLDYAVINTALIDEQMIRLYATEHKYPVEVDIENCQKYLKKTVIEGDFLKRSRILRHDSRRLLEAILKHI